MNSISRNQNLKLYLRIGSTTGSNMTKYILLFPLNTQPLALQGGTSSLAPLAASTTSKRDKDRSSKSRKRKSREEHQLYMDPKEAEYAAAAASTAASVTGKVLEEAFHQLCEMCGHYFQHPVTYHMRVAHPGCGGHSGSKGYNSGGNYCAGTTKNLEKKIREIVISYN